MRRLTLVVTFVALAVCVSGALGAEPAAVKAEPVAAAPAPAPAAGEWQDLFNGKDLAGWTGKKAGGWKVEDGVLVWQKGAGYLWTKAQFDNYILQMEFKLVKGCNSGIFIRTGNPKNPVQTGMEIQVLDSYGKKTPGKHDCGALYDAKAPKSNTIKKPGEWNKILIMLAGPNVGVILNGQPILEANLDKWTEAKKNPDGSKNKYKKPLKEFPRSGHIGIQDHGKSVCFRNIRILKLKTCPDCKKSGAFCKACQKENTPAVMKVLKPIIEAAMKKKMSELDAPPRD